MIEFSKVKSLKIPAGNVVDISSGGVSLWRVRNEPGVVPTVPITFSLASDFYVDAPLVYNPSLSYATIDGVEVGINKTKEIPVGTVISCFARHIEGSMLLGHIKLNGSSVVTASADGEWVSYDYTVTTPATINIASITNTVDNRTWSAGFVEIIETT